MKRRYPHDKPKRQKQRNLHRVGPSNERQRQEIQLEKSTETNSNFDDINEQLRIQRLKKKERPSTSTIIDTSDEDEKSNIEDAKAVLGKYTYDPKRKAYFPTINTDNCIDRNINDDDDDQDTGSYKNTTAQSSTLLPHRYMMMHHNNHVMEHQQRPSSAMMTSYVVQLLHGTKRRNNLIATNWYGTTLLNSMSILPIGLRQVYYMEPDVCSSGRNAPLSTLNRTASYHDTDNANYNTVGSALWTRGFDILPSKYSQQRQDDDNSDTHIHRSSWLQFVLYSPRRSIIHGRLIRNRNIFRYSTSTTTTLPECIVACLQPWKKATRFHIMTHENNGRTGDIVVPFECNDFATFHDHCVVTGGNNSRCSTINLRRMQQFEDRRRFHTTSDILCIESCDQTSSTGTTTMMDDDNSTSSGRPELIFFGHRNGLVQVHDLRTDDVQQIGKLSCHNHIEQKKNIDADSVLRIQPLFRERPDQLVARGRTCWMLFDLRRMGDSSSRAAVVHSVPLSTNSNLVPCKGMAVDPKQSVVMVPFQHQHSSGHDQYGVNVWSLDSGCYVGQKSIPAPKQMDVNRPIIRQHASNIELCSTITPVWSRSPPDVELSSTANITRNTHDTDKEFYISTKSYGLWMRLGYPYGMHHITCNGHWTCHGS